MADIIALKAELDADPLGRGYAAMTNAQAAADLNTVYRTKPRSQMSGDELFKQTVPAEFAALDNGTITAGTGGRDFQTQWLVFCARDQIDPFATANVEFVKSIFGAGSATVTALNAARNPAASRADELDLGIVTAGDVESARAFTGSA